MNRLKEEVHPLQNDAVLQTLFNVCDAATLPIMRQVCKKWKQESLGAYRNTAQVKVGWWRMHIDKKIESFPLAQFNQVDQDLQLTTKPFLNLKISKSDFMPDNTEEVMEVGEVLTNEQDMEIWGQMVEHMRLDVVVHLELDVIRLTVSLFNELVFQRMVSLETLIMNETNLSEDGTRLGMDGEIALIHPNIKTFSNDLMSGAGFTRTHVNVIPFLQQFIPKLPRLVDFQLGLVVTHPATIEEQMVGLMRSLERQGSVPALESLDLLRLSGGTLLFLPRNVIQTWSGKFPLSTLKIDIGCDTSVEDIRIFFGSFSSTLKHLHVCHGTCPEEIKQKQVFMEGYVAKQIKLPQLEVLVIDEIYDTNILLLNYFDIPLLKKLSLADLKLSNTMRTFDGPFNRMRLLENMRFFQLNVLDLRRFYPSIGFSKEEVELFGVAAPNIKELFINTGKIGLSVVCKTWPDLHVLHVFGSERNPSSRVHLLEPVDDETITGIPEGKKREDMDESVIPPNITYLQSLRKFILECQNSKWHLPGIICYLSDKSVYEGFIKLPYLYHLCFPILMISEEAKKALTSTGVTLFDKKQN